MSRPREFGHGRLAQRERQRALAKVAADRAALSSAVTRIWSRLVVSV